jgi:hypothetical protein
MWCEAEKPTCTTRNYKRNLQSVEKKKAGVEYLLFQVFTYKDYVPLKVYNRMQDNPNLILPGVYSKIGAHLVPKDTQTHKLILHHRKEVSPKKPAQYLMLTTGGKPVYLSSLYPTEQSNTFILEAGRQYYYINFTDLEAEIRPLKASTSEAESTNCLCISLGNDAIRLRTASNPATV